MSEIDAWQEADDILGMCGAMLSGSKIAPDGVRIVWNANVCTKEHGKIWFGDFNLTQNATKLVELANKLNTRVYILRERDARFKNEDNPLFDEAVYSVDEEGVEYGL